MAAIHSFRAPLICLSLAGVVFIWSGFAPYNRTTWLEEIAPILIVLPILLATYKSFPLTGLLYVLIALHAVILMIGGHYTYARVPLFNDLRDYFHGVRNSYDGLGHLAQGFVPAIAARELLLRTSPLKPGKWLFAIIVLSCLGISALYELIEWQVAVWNGGSAEDFLGTQGDPWDTQKDMALAGVGAILALLTLPKLHDRFLSRLTS